MAGKHELYSDKAGGVEPVLDDEVRAQAQNVRSVESDLGARGRAGGGHPPSVVPGGDPSNRDVVTIDEGPDLDREHQVGREGP